jgi:hypothetical protein
MATFPFDLSFGSIISNTSLADCVYNGIFNTINDFSAIFPTTGVVPDVIPSFSGRALGVQLANTSDVYDVGHAFTIEGKKVHPLDVCGRSNTPLQNLPCSLRFTSIRQVQERTPR